MEHWNCFFQVVDQKKLQKAEAKIKAKQDKRAQEDQTSNEIRGRCDDGIYEFLLQLLAVVAKATETLIFNTVILLCQLPLK